MGRYITSDPIGLEGGLNTYGYVYQNPLNWIDPFGLRRKTVPLGDGWTGDIDTFDVNGKASFEIHVKDPNGNEVGLYGPDGWFNKHRKKGRPEGIPDSVEDSCRSRAIDAGRRMNLIPDKGSANIKGDAWKRFFKGLPLIGPMSEAIKPSPLHLPEDHPAR